MMYRLDHAVMLHTPLRIMVLEDHDSEDTLVVFDLPSAQFACFGRDEISAVGVALDRKLAALL